LHVPLNLAWPLLQAAHERYDRGDLVGCGVRIREAIRRHLVAVAESHGLDVKKHSRSAGAVLRILRKRKLIELGDWLGKILDGCNRLAHCQPVKASEIRIYLEVCCRMFEDNGDYLRGKTVKLSNVDCWFSAPEGGEDDE
jgi:hypothetical protein